MRSPIRRGLLAATVLLTAGACDSSAGGPEVTAPSPTGETARACEALATDLPDEVDGESRGTAAGDSPYVAVWGDPAIVLRCGVPEPAVMTAGSETYDPGAEFVGVNDVTWLYEEQSDGARFTTAEREFFVEMTVPDDYAPEVNPLLDVAAAVLDHIPPDALHSPPDHH
ncbi:DUF3515 domain-containing protein [Streptomyces hainanensis]|uniref:DUF3515 domain-containing protein n=1 Tax=Streptomyces hainanensis TaxID=402648 RepID=UPI001FB77234|nr:DUF3515 domain-containing protein [Streptomyces hainanensis]